MTFETEPLVTVVVTAFDAACQIALSVKSLLDQTYMKIEVIVVDHGSRDGTLAVAQQLRREDPRVRVLSTIDHMSSQYARALGLLEARGSVILFQHARGWSAPSRIERQLRLLGGNADTRACECGALAASRHGTFAVWRGRRTTRSHESLMMSVSDAKSMFSVRGGIPEIGVDVVKKLKRMFGRRSIAYIDEPLYCEEWQASANTIKPVLHPMGQLPVIAGMATITKRRRFLPTVVESLVHQVDELHIHLNDYEQLPDSVYRHDNIHVTNFSTHGDLVDTGKFLPTMFRTDPHYLLTVDDDIRYPQDYADRMIMSVEQLGGSAAVGVHGAVLATPLERYYADRHVVHFAKSLGERKFVDILGTGTMAMRSSSLMIHLNDFRVNGMADLWFAIACRRAMVPRVVINRPANWLQQLGKGHGLYTAARRDDSQQTEAALANGPWGTAALADEVDHWLTTYGYVDLEARSRHLSALGFGPDAVCRTAGLASGERQEDQ